MSRQAVTLDAIPGLRRRLRLYLHDPGVDLVSRRIADERCWEPFETRLWLAAQRPGDTVVDVGANLGYFSLLSALAEAPARQIHAFEPACDNLALLRDNLSLNGCEETVQLCAGALAAVDGEGELRRSDSNRGDHQIYAGDGERAVERVRLLRGDRYLTPQVERIDLLKIDTQGSELAVVDGLWSLLRASREGLRLLIELTPFSLRLAGAGGRALVERLAELDLPMSIVDHVGHRIVASDAMALARWSDNVEATAGDRGFMNIFVGSPPVL